MRDVWLGRIVYNSEGLLPAHLATNPDVDQSKPTAVVPQAAGDRQTRERQRPTVDLEHRAPAASLDGQPFCPRADDGGRRLVGQDERSASQPNRSTLGSEDGGCQDDGVG